MKAGQTLALLLLNAASLFVHTTARYKETNKRVYRHVGEYMKKHGHQSDTYRSSGSYPKVKSLVLNGTLCGINDKVPCGGVYPTSKCPIDQVRFWLALNPIPNFWNSQTMCATKSVSNNEVSGKIGTLCGVQWANLLILCDGRNPFSDACPNGYQRYGEDKLGAWYCFKSDPNVGDLAGTLCSINYKTLRLLSSDGFYTASSAVNHTCGGYSPSNDLCPPSYTINSQTYKPSNTLKITLGFCYKN